MRAGAQLSDADKARPRAINAELATLASTIDKNVMADVNDAAVVVERSEQLAGLSEQQVATAAAATSGGLEGCWLLTLLNTADQPLLANSATADCASSRMPHRWAATAAAMRPTTTPPSPA